MIVAQPVRELALCLCHVERPLFEPVYTLLLISTVQLILCQIFFSPILSIGSLHK